MISSMPTWRSSIDGERKGRRQQGCPLFNDDIGDGHFSAAGSEVWAASVGRRLVLLLEKDRRDPGTHRGRSSEVRPRAALRGHHVARASIWSSQVGRRLA